MPQKKCNRNKGQLAQQNVPVENKTKQNAVANKQYNSPFIMGFLGGVALPSGLLYFSIFGDHFMYAPTLCLVILIQLYTTINKPSDLRKCVRGFGVGLMLSGVLVPKLVDIIGSFNPLNNEAPNPMHKIAGLELN